MPLNHSWDALNPGRYPGLLHGFLSSLEDSKSVGKGTGWLPLYASVSEHDELIGSMVCYLKTDSSASTYSIGHGQMPTTEMASTTIQNASQQFHSHQHPVRAFL